MAPSEKPRLGIRTVITTALTKPEWLSYLDSFNTVFGLKHSLDHFQRKYRSPVSGYSYHAFLTLQESNDDIVGALTVIPFEYHVFGTNKTIGLVVDVFIREGYRHDPFSLKIMFQKVKEQLIQDRIDFIVAVPNDTAYPFWKNIVKLKEITTIPYYLMPIRIGNLAGGKKAFNLFSIPFVFAWCAGFRLLSSFFSREKKQKEISLIRSEQFFSYRFPEDYQVVTKKHGCFYYRVYNENGISTVYLVEFFPRTPLLLSSALLHLAINVKADVILFVGMAPFFYPGWFRTPKRFEPKVLPLMGMSLLTESFNPELFRFSNWDFGLVNYDVR